MARRRVDDLAEFLSLILEEVHLPEQMGLLVTIEQGDLVEARQVRGQALGCPGSAGRLAVCRLRHGRHDLGFRRGIVETGMSDQLKLGFQHAPGPNLIDQAVDARPRAAKLASQDLDRDAHAVAAINLILGIVVEGSRRGGKNRPIRMLAVVSLQGEPNCFHGTCHFTCDPPRHLDQSDLAWTEKSHPTGATDDLVPLRVSQLSKS